MDHTPLPTGWRRISLGDVAEIQTGLAKGKVIDGDAVTLPYLRVANVQDGFLDLREVKHITVAARDVERYRLQHEDVLMTEGGDFDKLGRGCVWKSSIPICLHQNHVFAVRTNRDKLLPGFFAYQAASPAGRLYFLSCSKQSTNLASINSTQLKEMPVPLPPLAEQKAIAAVLSAWDRAIEQTAALIAAKERLKQKLMQQLLSGQRRLRGFRDPWQELHLGDVFTERREPGHNGLPTLSVTLDSGVVRREALDKPVRTSLKHEQHLLVRKGDIAYNMMRMWQGGSGMAMEDGVVSPAYVVCVPARKLDSRFAHHLFQSPRMIYLFWAYSYGLTDDRRRLYYDEFARIPVSIPSLKEQRRIAALLDCPESDIFLLKRRRESLKNQKRGLMQQLLTGKVRIPKSLLKKGAKS